MLIGKEQRSRLAHAIAAFYRFSPGRLTGVFALMLVQGATAGIGLLFILPLLHLAGFPIGAGSDAGLAGSALKLFSRLGLPLRLETMLVLYVAMVAGIATLNYRLAIITTEVQQAYVCHLRSTLYRKLLRSRWQFIMRHKMSDFVHSLGNQVQTMGMAVQFMLSLASRSVVLGVMVLLAFLLSWKMSLMAVGFAGLLMAALLPLNRRIYGSGKSQLLNFKSIFQMLTEQLASLKMIKSYGSEKHYANQLDRAGEAMETQNVRFARMNALTQWVYMVAAVSAFALFTYAALTWFALPLPTLLLLLLIFSRLLPQVSGLQKTYQQLLHQLPAFQDVERMSKDCESARETAGESGFETTVPAPVLSDRIALRDVTYRYPGGGRDILRGFSATIRRNQTVSLVGPSGVGKSTLADLIAGLLEPGSGKIFCDDVELEGDRRIAWRQSLAYVTQEVFLFHDTVRANLTWVAESLTEGDLWEALKAAAADDFVARLPQGLDTVIGDRGVRLSGGERQRLALARALLSKPQLLILDEATSALDHGNEEKIREALERLKGKLTIVIIAHRETTIEHADERIQLVA